jgi:hypothetical protein
MWAFEPHWTWFQGILVLCSHSHPTPSRTHMIGRFRARIPQGLCLWSVPSAKPVPVFIPTRDCAFPRKSNLTPMCIGCAWRRCRIRLVYPSLTAGVTAERGVTTIDVSAVATVIGASHVLILILNEERILSRRPLSGSTRLAHISRTAYWSRDRFRRSTSPATIHTVQIGSKPPLPPASQQPATHSLSQVWGQARSECKQNVVFTNWCVHAVSTGLCPKVPLFRLSSPARHVPSRGGSLKINGFD